MTSAQTLGPLDRHWIQTLAEADLAEGVWRLKDPDDTRRRAFEKVTNIIPELFEMAADAAAIFNLHCGAAKPLRIVPWQPDSSGAAQGFIIFCGAVQLKLEQFADFHLEESVVTVRDYQRHPKTLHSFVAEADSFGGLTWMMDKRLTMTTELIIKQLLQDICTAGVESRRK